MTIFQKYRQLLRRHSLKISIFTLKDARCEPRLY